MVKERYDNLDGLRTISCLCIIAMHIKANGEYSINPLLQAFMISWTHFVLLFLMISGFGMFCGYYEKFKTGEITLNRFYGKRYTKILPFFVLLILIDIVMNKSIFHVVEGITEATMVFGLLPNNQPDVIGVSWTLGVIFLFYILFPFFVFMFWTKRRAWFSFLMSILISIFCTIYYFTNKFVTEDFVARHNFLYCAPFFAGGAMVYLYRIKIKSFITKYRWLSLVVGLCLSMICFFLPNDGDNADLFILLRYLPVFLFWLMYAISVESKLLNNKVTNFLSGISMEMYLSHMLIFRIVEKLKGLYIFGHGYASLFLAFLLVVSGLLIFIWAWKTIANKVFLEIGKRKRVNKIV